jgi:hypothetical protein
MIMVMVVVVMMMMIEGAWSEEMMMRGSCLNAKPFSPPNQVKIEGASPAGSMMRGTWECMEVSRVGISKLNVSVGGETEDTVTILVRGAHVSMEHCDMRLLAPIPTASKQ